MDAIMELWGDHLGSILQGPNKVMFFEIGEDF